VVGSTLHASQGAVEIEDAVWDGVRLVLRLRPVPVRRGAVYIAANGRTFAGASGPLDGPASEWDGVVALPVRAEAPGELVLEFKR
jgi:hypothetical protein